MTRPHARWDGVPDAVRTSMRANKSKDTKPELMVRAILRKAGIGYRLHRGDLPGKPDIAFIGRRKAIFVHGCFWHRHAGCRRATEPKSRLEYWTPKFARNVARDVTNRTALESRGWAVLTIWECECKDVVGLTRKVRSFLVDSSE